SRSSGAAWVGESVAGAVVPLSRAPVLLTAVARLETRGTLGLQMNLIATHATSAVSQVDVSLFRLRLPADFAETPWPSMGTPGSSTLTPDHGAKWRRAP